MCVRQVHPGCHDLEPKRTVSRLKTLYLVRQATEGMRKATLILKQNCVFLAARAGADNCPAGQLWCQQGLTVRADLVEWCSVKYDAPPDRAVGKGDEYSLDSQAI